MNREEALIFMRGVVRASTPPALNDEQQRKWVQNCMESMLNKVFDRVERENEMMEEMGEALRDMNPGSHYVYKVLKDFEKVKEKRGE